MASPEDQHGSLAALLHSNAQGFLWRNDYQQTHIINKLHAAEETLTFLAGALLLCVFVLQEQINELEIYM